MFESRQKRFHSISTTLSHSSRSSLNPNTYSIRSREGRPRKFQRSNSLRGGVNCAITRRVVQFRETMGPLHHRYGRESLKQGCHDKEIARVYHRFIVFAELLQSSLLIPSWNFHLFFVYLPFILQVIFNKNKRLDKN